MVKTCQLCRNRIKDNEHYCWLHNDKPRKRSKKQIDKRKQKLKESLQHYGKVFGRGCLMELCKFRDDVTKHFEKERRRFRRIEEDHKEVMKIWEELYDEEYEVIPNKFKAFNEKKS